MVKVVYFTNVKLFNVSKGWKGKWRGPSFSICEEFAREDPIDPWFIGWEKVILRLSFIYETCNILEQVELLLEVFFVLHFIKFFKFSYDSVIVGAESSVFAENMSEDDEQNEEEGKAAFSSSWLPEKKKSQ